MVMGLINLVICSLNIFLVFCSILDLCILFFFFFFFFKQKTAYEILARLEFRRVLFRSGLEVLIITQPANLYYLTGFTGEAGALVAMRAEAALIIDGRFTVQAREEARGVSIRLQKSTLPEAVGRFLTAARVKRVGYDPAPLSVAQCSP